MAVVKCFYRNLPQCNKVTPVEQVSSTKESIPLQGWNARWFGLLKGSRSGFTKEGGHRWERVNVGFSAFHEGHGTGKTGPRGVTF
ncbi:MAG TPA: hypothetical protein VKM96_04115 [Candidatus Bathyarchaeia archaeon]|nr:hypothetical protein [Candidatus Bathyarchaeia archaeon]